jgi:DNA polymerase-3 subunit gamma/tau
MEQFIVSARKYRPQTFKDVIGQLAITNTLLHAIENNHLAQALLFTGPRGVGKTTCARILARKINQEGYDDPNEDFSFNVFELDAASNNGVDDIRSIIDQVRIPPQTGKYKVYIIDEVHMLSASAFNAFLKTLEEPPKHAIFILATTEKHKILPTILSRCQIFDFKRITINDTKEYLMEIAQNQNVQFEEEALRIISQKADGAMRDALSIFDRVVSYCGNNLTRQAVAENLNVLDYDYYIKVTDLILENDIPQLLLTYNDILSKGFDGHHFVAGLASHFRDLLVCKNPATLSLLEVSEQTQQEFAVQAQKASQEFLLQGISIANECDLKYKVSQNQRLFVELTLMQLASLTHDAEKKKAKYYIIPSNIFHSSKGIQSSTISNQPPVSAPEIKAIPQEEVPNMEVKVEAKIEQIQQKLTPTIDTSNRISSLSIKGLKQKVDVSNLAKSETLSVGEHLADPFTQEDAIKHWNDFIDILENKGKKLFASYMRLSKPVLMGTNILLEFPNQGSKEDFENTNSELVSYLKTNLRNYDLKIKITVIETYKPKVIYTNEEKYKHFKELNPNIELFRQTFELDL